MHSHALQLRELQRQELLAAAAYKRQLDQLAPTVPLEDSGVSQRHATPRYRLVTAMAALRPAPHPRSQATAN